MMKSKKIFYGILLICVSIVVGISLFVYLDKLIAPSSMIVPPTDLEIKLNYTIGGCEEKEEREYIKTRGLELEEKVEVRIDNSFINLIHHLNYVCCARIKAYLDSVENYKNYTLIKIKEKNEGEMCRCICDYQVNMKIGPLEKGKYRIQIWGIEFERAAGELLWEKEVIIGKELKLPNPASIYCLEQGGKLEIRKDKEGNEYGVCIFPDSSECEEWAFYRGECKPLSNFCGWSTYGKCSSDLDCIKGGCSGQVCQSKQEEPVITTCEWRDCYNAKQYGLECKCINEQCQWYS